MYKIKSIIGLILISTILLAACTTALPGKDPVADAPDTPVSSDDRGPVGEDSSDWAPAPGDADLVREDVEVETAEILVLESFPPQYRLHVTGWKGTPCDQLRVQVSEPDAQRRIEVQVYRLMDPAGICIQMLEAFDVSISLGELDSGTYTVLLNGTVVGEILAP